MNSQISAFAARLRAVRKAKSLDQSDFGALGGVHRTAQSKYERGETVPDADYLLRIGAAGIDICELLTGVPTETPAFTANELELMSLVRSVAPPVRDAIVTILRAAGGEAASWADASIHDGRNSFARDGDKR